MKFVKEFVVETKISATQIQNDALSKGILVDKPITDDDNKLLLAFTEKRNKDEIDLLINFFKTYE